MAEHKRTTVMTAEAMRKAVEAAEASLNKARSLLSERQRKLDRVDRNLRDNVYRERVNAIHQETDAQVNAVLIAGQSFDSLSEVLGQKRVWSIEKYLARHAVKQHSVEKENYLNRIVMQMQYMDGEGLSALADAALAGSDVQLYGIVRQVVTLRLKTPPASESERSPLLEAKTQLEAGENYPEFQTVQQLIRQADETYTSLIDTGRNAQGLSSSPALASELNPELFTEEQKQLWHIPAKAA